MWDGHTNHEVASVSFNIGGEVLAIARTEDCRREVATMFDDSLNVVAGCG